VSCCDTRTEQPAREPKAHDRTAKQLLPKRDSKAYSITSSRHRVPNRWADSPQPSHLPPSQVSQGAHHEKWSAHYTHNQQAHKGRPTNQLNHLDHNSAPPLLVALPHKKKSQLTYEKSSVWLGTYVPSEPKHKEQLSASTWHQLPSLVQCTAGPISCSPPHVRRPTCYTSSRHAAHVFTTCRTYAPRDPVNRPGATSQ
jgi:hypothetical protein